MKTITLYGGFHNVSSVRVRISDEDYESVKNGDKPVWEALSESQEKRLDKHFCGMKDCCCGGIRNKDVQIEF